MDDPDSLIRHHEIKNESSHCTEPEAKEINLHQASIIDVWTKALEDCEDEDANNSDEGIEKRTRNWCSVVNKLKWWKIWLKTFYPLGGTSYLRSCNGKVDISMQCSCVGRAVARQADRNSTSRMWSGQRRNEDSFVQSGSGVQCWHYQAGKAGFAADEEYWNLMQFERSFDDLIPLVAGCQSLITPMQAHVTHHMNMIEEDLFLVQKLQKLLSNTTG